ncbi:MAG: hypothetical protein NT041_01670, partial [Candidatus Vogelbacteria bacterium]|nr:hypothetical protein [Candidatus Vogelbacteria bacterium]
MVKSLISDRVIFRGENAQKKFLLGVKEKLSLSWVEMSRIIKVNPRTLRDWSKGKFKMSEGAVLVLSKKSKILIPKNLQIVSWDKHLQEISKKGGEANYLKNQTKFLQTDYRDNQWKKWWGSFDKEKSKILYKRKKITLPARSSDLAEFVGIMIGDGGVAPYHISITLNSKTDFEYSKYVCRLLKKLLNVSPKIYRDKDSLAMNLIIHRIELVDFCQKIGLKKGNKLKQNLDLPDWVKESDKFFLACLRGLFDTEGSVFIHRYKSGGKMYHYPKMSFTSRSEALIKSVWKALKKFGFNARISRSGWDIRLESQEDVARFDKLIGTSNPK